MTDAALPTATPELARSEHNLIWIDLEMTGLSPLTDRILEIAVVVTDPALTVRVEGPVFAIHQSDEALDAMDSWNKGTHKKSGLIDKVRASRLTEAEAEAQAVQFLRQHVPVNVSPMCGNSICQDRRFLARWMPKLEAHFHYRNLDVSTLKELVRRWKPEAMKGFAKEGRHEAMADILESIEELKFYRRSVMTI